MKTVGRLPRVCRVTPTLKAAPESDGDGRYIDFFEGGRHGGQRARKASETSGLDGLRRCPRRRGAGGRGRTIRRRWDCSRGATGGGTNAARTGIQVSLNARALLREVLEDLRQPLVERRKDICGELGEVAGLHVTAVSIRPSRVSYVLPLRLLRNLRVRQLRDKRMT